MNQKINNHHHIHLNIHYTMHHKQKNRIETWNELIELKLKSCFITLNYKTREIHGYTSYNYTMLHTSSSIPYIHPYITSRVMNFSPLLMHITTHQISPQNQSHFSPTRSHTHIFPWICTHTSFPLPHFSSYKSRPSAQ